MILSLLEWFLLYILIVKFPPVATSIKGTVIHKNLGVGNDVYTDPQISPSIALLILKFPRVVNLHENSKYRIFNG